MTIVIPLWVLNIGIGYLLGFGSAIALGYWLNRRGKGGR